MIFLCSLTMSFALAMNPPCSIARLTRLAYSTFNCSMRVWPVSTALVRNFLLLLVRCWFMDFRHITFLDNRTCNLGDIRVVDGDTDFSGRLEVCIGDDWGTVCNLFGFWGEEEANVACSQLGYASVGRSHLAILCGMQCTCIYTDIWKINS